MTGESGWTIDTLREWVSSRLEEMRRAADERQQLTRELIQAQFDDAERAVAKAEAANERRFASVNEFRAQLSDQARSFIGRTEYETAHGALSDKLDFAERRLSEQLNALTSRIDMEQGRDKGSWERSARTMLAIGSVVGFLGVVVAAVSLLLVNR